MKEIKKENFYSLVCFTEAIVEHGSLPVSRERLDIVVSQFMLAHRGHNLSMVVGVVKEVEK